MTSELKKLQFGCYYVTLAHSNPEEKSEEILCKPLTQSDYAEGWKAVLPKKKQNSTVYNWNVNLAQLPPHLWDKCHLKFNKDGKPYYHRISDNIYTYNVSITDHDTSLFQLNKELCRPCPSSDVVKQLYDEVKQHVSGWLILRAKSFLQN
jgi:hypothetical protein